MNFFRSSSKKKEAPAPAAPVLRNPLSKDKMNLLIDCEAKFNKGKLSEELITQLWELYTVNIFQAASRRILRSHR